VFENISLAILSFHLSVHKLGFGLPLFSLGPHLSWAILSMDEAASS
jgi:hypothetical protein